MIRHLRSFLTEVMLRSFKFTKEGDDLIGEVFIRKKQKKKVETHHIIEQDLER